MPTPSFSEFVKTLFRYCGGGQTTPEFVITLTNKIMRGQPGRAVGGGYKNPIMEKDVRTLQSYFSGSRQISSKDARTIVGNIDQYRFEEYIRSFSEKALADIEADLNKLPKVETLDHTLDTAGKCAEIFTAILKGRASSDRKTSGIQD